MYKTQQPHIFRAAARLPARAMASASSMLEEDDPVMYELDVMLHHDLDGQL
jgi:hypothetical protein